MSKPRLNQDGSMLSVLIEEPISLKKLVSDIEIILIQDTLDRHGNTSGAAKALGLQRTTLAMKMRRYGLSNPNAPADPNRRVAMP